MAKQAAKSSKAQQAIVKSGIVGFDTKAVTNALRVMSVSQNQAETANDKRGNAALELLKVAAKCRNASRDESVSEKDIRSGWRASINEAARVVGRRGSNRFVEVIVNDDGMTMYRLTGYGKNVSSVALGVLESKGVDGNGPIDPFADGMSFEKCREAVRLERNSKKEADPLADIMDSIAESFKTIRSHMKDVEVTVAQQYADNFAEIAAALVAQKAQQAELAEQAKAAKAA